MAEMTFTVEHANLSVAVGKYGFSNGFIVIRHESGSLDTYASRVYRTRAEAEKRAAELREEAANNTARDI